MPGTTSPSLKPQIVLRLAQPKDVQTITTIGSTVFSLTFGYSLPASDLAAYLDDAYGPSSIASDLANPQIDTIVACSDLDHVIGFAQLTRGTLEECLSHKEKQVELQRLYVAQEYHGMGVGKALIERVEEMAREQGFRTLWLGVWEENLKAQKVYERMGFEKVGEHDFKMGECVQTDWILSKDL